MEDLLRALQSVGIRVSRPGTVEVAVLGKADMRNLQQRLTCILRDNYLREAAADASVAGVLVPPALETVARERRADWWVVCHEQPMRAFWDLHHALLRDSDFFGIRRGPPQIDPSARVSPLAAIEDGVRIGPDCVVDAFAVLKRGATLGARVVIGPHCVIGKDGFEKLKFGGVMRHMHHAGGVVIEDDVMLHSGVQVDRAIWGNTSIGRGTQMDNLCHVGHGCVIGENNLFASGVILGGVAKIGDDNFFGMNSTVKHNIQIGSNCRIAMGAAVLKQIADGTKLVVTQSQSDREFLESLRAQRRS